MTLLQLFWSFFQIGAFSIGGGYAAMPLIQHQIVEIHGWLNMTQFADVVTIAEMTPGPIAINAATFVGTRIGGTVGALVATLGCILPSILIVLTLAYLYKKYCELNAVQGILGGLRPAVVGLIASAGMAITAFALWGGSLFAFSFSNLKYISIGLFIASLFVLQKWKINPILVMVGAGAVGLCLFSFL